MATSSKKITYTSDFKLKVLDYYFKNGGDEKFGLKKKTAGHFNIDKKTINRMLNNPDMVKRARKLLSKRVTGSAKAGVRPGGSKATTKGTKVGALSSKAGGSKASTSGSKVATPSTSGKVASSGNVSVSDSSSSSSKAPTLSTMSTKHVGVSSSNQGSSTSQQASAKSSSSKIKYMGRDVSSGVQVFDLPEDPDYSLLKQSIDASTTGVANIARLLVTGTEEVRNIILNECDMILECKVCHNLFRSVVNFLAHKRIYCQEEFADVRMLFHKDDVQGVTSHSNTVIVEPEPPPDKDSYPSTSSASETLTKPARTAMQGNSSRTGIDSIAAKLANRKKHCSASHASHTGSSRYFERLDCVNSVRDKLSRDCSVVLEDIAGVTNARYQTYVPPAISTPTVSMNAIVDEVTKCSSGLTVAINEHGEIMKTAPGNVGTIDVEEPIISSGMSNDLVCRTCNTRFATQKTLSVHQRSHHGFKRYIYCCPICKSTFLSMWAVVKHLQRHHKKTKNQTERLRKVIKKNVYKKMVYHSEDHHGEYCEMDMYRQEEDKDQEEDQNIEEGMAMEEENSTNNQTTEGEIQDLQRSTILGGPRKCSPTKSPMKGWRSKEGVRWMCNVCLKMFITRAASLAHVATHIICNFEPRAVLVNVETGERVRQDRGSPVFFKSPSDSSDSEEEEEYDSCKEEPPEEEKEAIIEEPLCGKESQVVTEPEAGRAGATEGSYEGSPTGEQGDIYSEINLKENPQNLKIDVSPPSVEREVFEPLSGIKSDVVRIASKLDFKNKTSSPRDKPATSDEGKIDVERSKDGTPARKLTQFQLAAPTRVRGGNVHNAEDMDVDLESVLLSSLNLTPIPYPESRLPDVPHARSCWESQSQEDVHKAASELRLFEEDWSSSSSSGASESEKEELKLQGGSPEVLDIDSGLEDHVMAEEERGEDSRRVRDSASRPLRASGELERDGDFESSEAPSDEAKEADDEEAGVKEEAKEEVCLTEIVSLDVTEECIKEELSIKEEKEATDELTGAYEEGNNEGDCPENLDETKSSEDCIDYIDLIDRTLAIHCEKSAGEPKTSSCSKLSDKTSECELTCSPSQRIKDEDSTVLHHEENGESQSADLGQDLSTQSLIHGKELVRVEENVDSVDLPKYPRSVNCSKSSGCLASEDSSSSRCAKGSVSCMESEPSTENFDQAVSYVTTTIKCKRSSCCEPSSITQSESSLTSVSTVDTIASDTHLSEVAAITDFKTLAPVSQEEISSSCVTLKGTSSFEPQQTSAHVTSEVPVAAAPLSEVSTSVTHSDDSVGCGTLSGASAASAAELTAPASPVSTASFTEACLKRDSLEAQPKTLVETRTTTISGNERGSSLATATILKSTAASVTPSAVSASVTYTKASNETDIPALSHTSPNLVSHSQDSMISSSVKPTAPIVSLAHTYNSGITVTKPKTTMTPTSQLTLVTALTETEVSSVHHQKKSTIATIETQFRTVAQPRTSTDVTEAKSTTACLTQLRTIPSSEPPSTSIDCLTQPMITSALVTQPRVFTTFSTQPRTTTVPKTIIAALPQLGSTTPSITQPRITTDSLTLSRSTPVYVTKIRASPAFLTKPVITTMTQFKIANKSVTQSMTTSVEPRMTTSLAQSRNASTSLTHSKSTSVSMDQPKTASVSQPASNTTSVISPRISTASESRPRINSASETQSKPTIISVARVKATSVTQPRSTSASQTHTIPILPDKISVPPVEGGNPPASNMVVALAKNSLDSTPKAAHMPERKPKGHSDNSRDIVKNPVNRDEGNAENSEKSLMNVSYEMSDENITRSIAQNESSCNITSKDLSDHTENIDNLFSQFKCIPDCCDENIAHTCRVFSRNVQNPVPYSKDHSAHVDEEDIKKEEKSRPQEEKRIADYLEIEVNKGPVLDKANGVEVLEKSECRSRDGIEDYNYFRKMYSGQNASTVVVEVQEPSDDRSPSCLVDERDGQRRPEPESMQPTASLPETSRINPSSSRICLTRQENKHCGSGKGRSKEAPDDDAPVAGLQRLLRASKHQGVNCKKTAVEGGPAKKSSNQYPFYLIRSDRNYSADGRERKTRVKSLDSSDAIQESRAEKRDGSCQVGQNTKKRERESGEVGQNTKKRESCEVALNTKKRERESVEVGQNTKKRERESGEVAHNTKKREGCEVAQNTKRRERESGEVCQNTKKRESCDDAHIKLVTEIFGIDKNAVKKMRSVEKPAAQKILGLDEACSKESERRDGGALKFKHVTTSLEKQNNSPCIETRVSEAEDDILQKVRDDWAQLSSDPQWKWRKRERNKELWKLVMAVKATVSSKKSSQKRDHVKPVPDASKCSTSTDIDENQKEQGPTGTVENIDKVVPESKFTSFTSVQYLKGKKWSEDCNPQKKKENASEVCECAVICTEEETVVDDNITVPSKQQEDKVIFMCSESPHRLSPVHSKDLDMIILEDGSNVDDGTTIDEAAVMPDPTTFGDLSYYYDLH